MMAGGAAGIFNCFHLFDALTLKGVVAMYFMGE
jgi:hypothetical protein